jgi:hypothetical protein
MSEEMAKSFVLWSWSWSWSWLCPLLRVQRSTASFAFAAPRILSHERRVSSSAQLGLRSTIHMDMFFLLLFSRTGDSFLEGSFLIDFGTSLLFSKCFCCILLFLRHLVGLLRVKAWSWPDLDMPMEMASLLHGNIPLLRRQSCLSHTHQKSRRPSPLVFLSITLGFH